MHTRLFATPWLRKPDLAQKLQIQNAPAIMQNIQQHIQEHMQFLAQNATAQTTANAGAQRGQEPTPPSPALGHAPPPASPSPDLGTMNKAQGMAQGGMSLPNAPQQPQMPARH